ncbi:hypothetical protein A3C20_04065 [Candidatus Kaiserbacteria bacterium RIFCSPHIGHO2_02_FULL_55_25]|uniref:Uncharacterized protein n=1 Tax=Candidatus Kaiserbacteria bacterium RIFCSPHIGHO2_02_FULL_55_25 TaxID=1798498 RepID=A0A1F6E6N8_9BACT|nr:MAG: hypothetical protein A3C20_04065 [Candidatus Kaiserbacteria bacterium RIFCSPHIGHO2_02_FULL_55_25]OGG83477.1 MAG: hypothetical protein A3A42_01170 [Candidatus Kaiserbacteria bacterium RIFCSPLOWO2_01_FULL_55_25]
MNGGFLFRTAIVHVAMNVAVLLPFQFILGGDGKTALPAPQKAAIRLRLVRRFVVRATAEREDFLYLVEQFFADDRRMCALVHFAAIREVAEVKRIGEQKCYLVFFERSAAALAPSARGTRLDAALKKKLRDIFESRAVLGVQLKRFPYERRFAPIRDNSLGIRVVEVAQRRGARIYTHSRFLPEASCHIHAQIADVLIGHAELHGHEEYVVVRKIRFVVCNDFLDSALLQKPTDTPAIHGIAREAVYLPTHDAVRFAALDTFQHFLKHGTARHLRAPLLHKLLCNLQSIALGERAKLGKLRLDGEHLLVLDIGAFACVEEIEHTGIISTNAQG